MAGLVGAKPVLVRQVKHRHKAGFGAAGLGSAQKTVLEWQVERRCEAGRLFCSYTFHWHQCTVSTHLML